MIINCEIKVVYVFISLLFYIYRVSTKNMCFCVMKNICDNIGSKWHFTFLSPLRFKTALGGRGCCKLVSDEEVEN